MANLTTVLDIVKVMAFALQEGKIAVHCHAGLGRTGRAAPGMLTRLFDRAPMAQCHNIVSLPFLRCVNGMFFGLCHEDDSQSSDLVCSG